MVQNTAHEERALKKRIREVEEEIKAWTTYMLTYGEVDAILHEEERLKSLEKQYLEKESQLKSMPILHNLLSEEKHLLREIHQLEHDIKKQEEQLASLV